MRSKRELFSTIGRRLDIPREALPCGFGIILSGQSSMTVRGCRRILTYGREQIRLSLGKTVLAVGGERLLCTAFESGCVTVEGKILTVAFEERGEGDAT